MVHRVGSVLIVFLLTGLTASVTFSLSRQYTFVDTEQTWTEAQQVCRSTYTDLATIENAADVDAVVNTAIASNYTETAWIGLYDDLEDSWTWSYNESSYYAEGEATFRNWLDGQPSNLGGQQHCVELFSGSPFFGGWADQECSSRQRFACFNATVDGTASFALIALELNWTEAQTYCRENYFDLASIRNQEENDDIAKLAAGQVVWIGLSRQKSWSDGSSSLFRNWASAQPDSGDEQCVATSLNQSGLWSDENCSLSLPFICYTTILANADGLKVTGQNETSVSLQWDKVDNNVSYILLLNGTETNIRAPDGDGPVNYTVSSLTAATRYTFTVFSVFENIRSSGVSITAVTASHIVSFFSVGRNETSISLQWDNVGDNVSYVLLFNGTETNIRAPDGDGPVNYTVSSLTAATTYSFTVFPVFDDVSSNGVSIVTATAPPNTASFRSVGQNETSVSLQWDKVDDNVNYILYFNGTETNIRAPDGDGPVNYTVSPLTAATRYTFTVFSVFEKISSSGVSITAVTAPPNPASFTLEGQSGTSIFLQWDKVDDNVTFVLLFDGTETNISAPDGDGPVFYTVSSLTAATRYTFTVFSVYENVRSSGVSITAVTAPPHIFSLFSVGRNETSISLQWDNVGDNVNYVLLFNGTETNIRAPDGDGPVNYTVSSLTAATRYSFTVFPVFENVSSSRIVILTATAPPNTASFRSVGKNEASVSLQWDKVDGNVNFILLFNGTETNIRAPDGDGPVNYIVSPLTAATRYTFTVFSVFENISSSGVSITAVTAPPNAVRFFSVGQNETSISLQWDNVGDNVSYVLLFNGTETNIRAPDGDGRVNYTVSSLTAATRYSFTVFSVFENVRSSGVSITAFTAPPNTASFRSVGQNETSVSLQWDKVDGNVSFILLFNGTETNIRAPDGDGPVNYTVSPLTAATRYTFTVFSVHENVRSSGVSITAVTAPPNTASVFLVGHYETSIFLQWNNVGDNVSYVLLFNGTETNIRAPDGDGPVNYTISPLTAATRYVFTVFSVFENISNSGVSITAVTAPPNTASFLSVGQNETSVSLQWDKVDGNVSYVLLFSGTETNIRAPDGDGPVNYTVSPLTPSTKYTFTVFSVYENVWSSGVSITAVTDGPQTILGFNIKLTSPVELSESDIQGVIEELLRTYGLSSQVLALKVHSIE